MPKHESPLRSLRKTRTLTQEQMSTLLGVTQQNYSKYETGVIVPPPPMQARIAAILGVSPEQLWPQEVHA